MRASQKGGGILAGGTPAHSALLGVPPALPSLHIRAAARAHAAPARGYLEFVNYSSPFFKVYLREPQQVFHDSVLSV